jgi:hypothetical protein
MSVWTLWRREKSCTAEYRTHAIQTLVRRYTYSGIPATENIVMVTKNVEILKDLKFLESLPTKPW